MICTFDPYNDFKQSASGLIHVRVLRLHKNSLIKKKRLWKVECVETPENTYTVPESHLFPCGMSVVRYPVDMPVFGDFDLKYIDRAIDLIDGMDANTFKSLSNNAKYKKYDVVNRLKAIAMKINYYNSMRDI